MLNKNCPSWFASAPCVGKDRLFFSAHPAKRKIAVSICNADCSFKQLCLDFAVDNNMTIGVWGGKTGPELTRIIEGAFSGV